MASYGGATLKVTELFSKAILLTMFVYGDFLAVCLIFIYLSTTGVTEIAKSTNLKWCPQTFVYIVYKCNKKRLKKDFTELVCIRKSVNLNKLGPSLWTGETDMHLLVTNTLKKKFGAWIRKPVSIWCDHHFLHAA